MRIIEATIAAFAPPAFRLACVLACLMLAAPVGYAQESDAAAGQADAAAAESDPAAAESDPGAGAGQSDAEVEAEYALARRAYDFARETMSPFCPGRTLADCPSPNAKVLRERVRRMMASGLNEEDIALQLRREYGDVVRALPRTPIGWILPGIILGIGVILLGVVLVRLSRPAPAVGSVQIDRALEKELDEALREQGLDRDPAEKSDRADG